MRVFITGISGLLGRHITKVCLSKGYNVIGLVRNKEKFQINPHPNLRIVEGDLSNVTVLEKHTQDVDAVIHSAANTSMSIINGQAIFKTNVEGTKNLIFACKNNKRLKAFIYISSANTIASGSYEKPNTKALRIKNTHNQLPYVRSKIAAEDFIKKHIKGQQFPAIIFNPTFILGPEDYKPSSGKLLKAVIDQKIKFYTSGSKNIIDVRDAAKAIVQALVTGKIGEQYLLCNKNISFKALFSLAAKYADVAPPKYLLPNTLTYCIGYLGSLYEKLSNKSIQINHQTIRFSTSTYYYSAKKAIQDLNFQNRPTEETIQDTINWLKHINRFSPDSYWD